MPAQTVPAGTKGIAGLASRRPLTGRLSGKLTAAASLAMTRLPDPCIESGMHAWVI
jgi:hypothetical protein